MERARKSLWSALRRVARPESPLDMLAAVWPLMVGDRLAAHTRPVAWKKGRVEVAVTDREWQQQLEPMAGEVRTQINKWWGSDLVQEVSFVRGKPARPAASRPATPPPGRAQGKAHAQREGKLRSALKDLEGPLAGIADQELRDLIARVAEEYLTGRGRKR